MAVGTCYQQTFGACLHNLFIYLKFWQKGKSLAVQQLMITTEKYTYYLSSEHPDWP